LVGTVTVMRAVTPVRVASRGPLCQIGGPRALTTSVQIILTFNELHEAKTRTSWWDKHSGLCRQFEDCKVFHFRQTC
jgi:hypothetical protein